MVRLQEARGKLPPRNRSADSVDRVHSSGPRSSGISHYHLGKESGATERLPQNYPSLERVHEPLYVSTNDRERGRERGGEIYGEMERKREIGSKRNIWRDTWRQRVVWRERRMVRRKGGWERERKDEKGRAGKRGKVRMEMIGERGWKGKECRGEE